MPIFHNPDGGALQKAEMGDAEFLAIGRLLRAYAEIEDALTLFIGHMFKITPGATVVLLGQTTMSKKLAIANYVAEVRGAKDRYNGLFPKQLSEVTDCRNAVAHGALLGQWEGGKWAFETPRTVKSEMPGFSIQTVMSFRTSDIQSYAKWAEEIAAIAAKDAAILALREERQRIALLPSHKSQQKPQRGAKSQPQPPSSRA